MKTNTIFVLTSLLSLAVAVPVQEDQLEKRDLIIQTVVQQVIETVTATTTITLPPGQDPPTSTLTSTTTTASVAGINALQQANQNQDPAPASPTTSTSTTSTSTSEPPASSTPAAVQVEQDPPSDSTTSDNTGNTENDDNVDSDQPASDGNEQIYPVETLTGATFPTGPCTAAQPCTGNATWYDTGLGACGETSGGDEMVVAIYRGMMGTDSSGTNVNELCGRKVVITGPGGQTATGTVVDKCFGCNDEPHNLDLSKALFKAIGDGDGVIQGIKWHWA